MSHIKYVDFIVMKITNQSETEIEFDIVILKLIHLAKFLKLSPEEHNLFRLI